MPGKGEKIAVDRLHIDRCVAGALGGIHHGDHPCGTGTGANLGDRVDCAHRVGNMREREQPGTGELLVEPLQIKLPVVAGDLDEVEFCADPVGQNLPRHEVAVVLHLGEQNRVALAQLVERPSVGDEVQPLGGAARENNFLAGAGVEVVSDSLARALVRLGGAVAQLVDATVHVGVIMLVVAANRIDDLMRLLAACGVVEINQRVAVDGFAQDREVVTERCPID